MSDSTAPLKRPRDPAMDSPSFGGIVRLYETLGPLLEKTDLSVEPASLEPDQAIEKLAAGFPLLQDVELHLDGEKARRLLIELAGAVEERIEGARNPCRKLRQGLETGKLETSRLMASVAAGDRESVRLLIEPLGLESGFIWTLVSFVFRATLHITRRQLSPLLEGAAWNRGHCPICGSMPLFAELRGRSLKKHLRCGRCGADWPGRRLHCLYCGNEDHRTLGILFDESRHEPGRVEFCERCGGYLKIIITFEPTPPEHLPIVDLATIHLNDLAEKHGYRMDAPAK